MKNKMNVLVREGVILAAGASERTAPDCKLAFDLGGQTLLELSIRSMAPFCDQIYVVTGSHEETVAGILQGRESVTLVNNPDHTLGMYGSVKAGLRRTTSSEVFLLPGDCPFVTSEVYTALLETKGRIVVPVWNGHMGHPVLLRREAIQEILEDSACESLREFIGQRRPRKVPVSCKDILRDIDTREDYRQALQDLTEKGGSR